MSCTGLGLHLDRSGKLTAGFRERWYYTFLLFVKPSGSNAPNEWKGTT